MLKTVVLGYFLTLINNIGVRNLKKNLTLQKGSKQKGVNFLKIGKNQVPLLSPSAGSQEFFEISNPDIINQHQKYRSTTVFSKLNEHQIFQVFWLFFRISQKIGDNSSYERARISFFCCKFFKGFLRSCQKIMKLSIICQNL